MAKRDFAKVQSQAKNKQSGKDGMPAAMAAISLLLTAVVGFSGGYMTGEKQNAPQKLKLENNNLKQQLAEKTQLLNSLNAQLKNQREIAEANKTQAKHHPDALQQVGDLTFYNTLPKQKVMPSPLGDAAPMPTGNATKHASSHAVLQQDSSSPQARHKSLDMAEYHLQLGSYIRRSDAEGFFNRLAKAGLAAQVNKKMVKGIGVRYRVIMGPFYGLAAAEAARSDAREKLNVDGLLLRE